MSASSKLGRNPLHKKRASPVSKLIEDERTTESTEPEVLRESRDLYDRLRQMEIELDWSQVLRRLYGRIKRRPV
ncbi:MAG: hypothetical protein ABL958_15375 [Bdellovibrionia bacterium]